MFFGGCTTLVNIITFALFRLINIGTYIGKKKFGMAGAVLGTLAVTLPSFLCIVAIVLFLDQFENSKVVRGVFVGLKAAACGLIAIALYRLGKNVLKSPLAWILAVATLIAIVLFDVNAVITIVAGAAIGLGMVLVNEKRKGGGS